LLHATLEIWKFLKENLVTRKPEKHKFLTILKKKNWLNFARENPENTRERVSSRVLLKHQEIDFLLGGHDRAPPAESLQLDLWNIF
jgi:hypothetical protein